MGLGIEPEDDRFVHGPSNRWPTVSMNDPRWFERFWLNVHSIDGRLALGHGIGAYPNLGVRDAFALLVLPDRQHNIRASAHGAADPGSPAVGPFRAEILEPMKRWAFHLAPGHGPFSFDLEFEAAQKPLPHILPEGVGSDDLPVRWCTFVQTGRPCGTIRYENRTFEVWPDSWWAGRDRSWGVRPGIGSGGEMEWLDIFQKLGWGFLLHWVLFRIGEKQVWYFGTQEPQGGSRHFVGTVSEAGRTRPITDVENVVKLAPDTGRLDGAWIRIRTADGGAEEYCVEKDTSVYLRGGWYSGLNGFHHGSDRGPLLVESDTWDRNNADDRAVAAGLNDHVCRFTGKEGQGRGVYEIHYGA